MAWALCDHREGFRSATEKMPAAGEVEVGCCVRPEQGRGCGCARPEDGVHGQGVGNGFGHGGVVVKEKVRCNSW